MAPLTELDRKIVHGYFVEASHGRSFQFARDQKDPPWPAYADKVWVGPRAQYRWARVMKTVAHIVIDEDGDGSPVVEKWILRRLTNWIDHAT